MTTQHTVTTMLHEADATYSWLLPDGTILPVTGQRRHEAVAGDYYRERFKKNLEGGTYEDWAKAQGWARLVGTGFEAGKLTKQLLRRVQQTYLDAGVREMGTSFFIDISGPGGRDMQVFEVPYRDFLDIINPGELRRYKFESRTATLESKGQIHRLFGEGLDDDITAAYRDLLTYITERVEDHTAQENFDRKGLGLFMRYYSLRARAGQARMGEAGELHPTDAVDMLAQALQAGEKGGASPPDYSEYVDIARHSLRPIQKITRMDYLSGGDGDKEGVLLDSNMGTYQWTPSSWRDDEALEDQGSLSYGDMDAIKLEAAMPQDFIMPAVMSGSDYSGDTLHRSNYQAFMRDFGGEGEDDEDEGVPGIYAVYGGYGTYAAAIQISVDNEDVWEALAGLTDYHVYDEEAMSEFERDASYEAWQNWGEAEFRGELAKRFDEDEEYNFERVSNEDMFNFFNQMAELANVYWESETGGGMYIRMERVADAAAELSEEDLNAIPGIINVARQAEEEAEAERQTAKEQERETGQQFMFGT